MLVDPLCQEIAPLVAVEGKTSKLLKGNKYRKPWATKRVKALQSKPKLFTKQKKSKSSKTEQAQRAVKAAAQREEREA